MKAHIGYYIKIKTTLIVTDNRPQNFLQIVLLEDMGNVFYLNVRSKQVIVIMQPTVYSFLLCKNYKDSFRSNCIAFLSESIMTIRKKIDSSGSCKGKETFENEIKVCQ